MDIAGDTGSACETGFRKSAVYFAYRDEEGAGIGEWYTDEKGEAAHAWVEILLPNNS